MASSSIPYTTKKFKGQKLSQLDRLISARGKTFVAQLILAALWLASRNSWKTLAV